MPLCTVLRASSVSSLVCADASKPVIVNSGYSKPIKNASNAPDGGATAPPGSPVLFTNRKARARSIEGAAAKNMTIKTIVTTKIRYPEKSVKMVVRRIPKWLSSA